jgi:hypothetical protein
MAEYYKKLVTGFGKPVEDNVSGGVRCTSFFGTNGLLDLRFAMSCPQARCAPPG